MRQIDPARRTTPTVESSLPGVAVCIPSFNSAATIRRCLESVAGQTYPALTIAISDDCSADGTEAVIRQFRDPRVTYVRQPRRLGMVPNWRACLALSDAPYVLLLGADDYLKPRMIERCVAMLEAHADMAFCHTATEFFDDRTGAILAVSGAFTASYVRDGRALLEDFLYGTRVCSSAAVFRRACFNEIGGWSDRYRNCMDLDLWFRMLLRWEVGFVGEILAGFRSHAVAQSWALMQVEEDVRFLEDMFDRLPPTHQFLQALREPLRARAYGYAFRALAALPPSAERDAIYARLSAGHYAAPSPIPMWRDLLARSRSRLMRVTAVRLAKLPRGVRFTIGAAATRLRRRRPQSMPARA